MLVRGAKNNFHKEAVSKELVSKEAEKHFCKTVPYISSTKQVLKFPLKNK
jgi:hypothetical protein